MKTRIPESPRTSDSSSERGARSFAALVDGPVRERTGPVWALAVLLTAAWWAALGWSLHDGGMTTTSATLLTGGWGLGLLPVHCARRMRAAGAAVPRQRARVLSSDCSLCRR